jgi:hypothetical protein
MQRVFFYSDETGPKSKGRFFIVAGIAIEAHHGSIRRQLLEAEDRSRKGKLDWHGTKEPRRRRRYLEAAFNIRELQGHVFYYIHTDTQDYWGCTVKTLRRAIERFAQSHQSVIMHEGFTHAGREGLKRSIQRAGAEGRFEVRAGAFKSH